MNAAQPFILIVQHKGRIKRATSGLALRLFSAEATVTGIDLSEKMLRALREKFPKKELQLIRDSYFDVPLGENPDQGFLL